MKAIIIYASTHHGNTRKVAEAIAKGGPAEMLDATVVTEKDLRSYDLIGFASGIYAGNFHKAVMDFAKKNLPERNETISKKKIFYLMTSAMNKDFSSSMNRAIAGKNVIVLGAFSCIGYNTFGPFKLVGGTGKGHPDEKDLQDAVAFFQEMKEKAGIREIPVDAADMDRFRFKGKQTGDAIRRFGKENK